MALTIGSNIASLGAQRQLGKSTEKVSSIFERLSSGLRINHASDDAAGLAVATSLKTDSRIFTQAIRNVNDGISVLNIAQGATEQLSNVTTRLKELAEQAANGTYSTVQRNAINKEADALVNEFNRITAVATFNGIKLLDGQNPNSTIQAGVGANAILNLGTGNGLSRGVGDGTFTFSNSSALGSGGYTEKVYLVDFNNDGKLDTFTAGNGVVSLGNGDGTFTVGKTVGGFANNVKFADVNGDGVLDIVSAAGSGNGVKVTLGNGDGTFKATVSYGAASGVNFLDVAVGDFNGDGTVDIASVSNDGYLTTFNGTGGGSFGTAKSTYVGPLLEGIAAGDLNNDGKVDLVVKSYGASYGSSTGDFVAVLTSNGNGTFAITASVAVNQDQYDRSPVIADLNNDGYLDVLTNGYDVGTGGTRVLYTLQGAGNGTLGAAVSIGNSSRGFEVGDINGDGIQDVATLDWSASTTYVRIGNGDGTFKLAYSFDYSANSAHAADLTLGDVDGNGSLDMLLSLNGGDTRYLYKANTVQTTTLQKLNLNSQAAALNSINVINTAFDRVSKELGNIGAQQSRFGYAINNLQSANENYLAAASRITDIDVAEESSQLVSAKILQQAGVAILAQANVQPQLALTLLRQV